jgi:hypothetical protein
MMRRELRRGFFRLSMIGTKLPFHRSYGPATTPVNCEPGFDVFRSLVACICNTISPIECGPTAGNLTPADGYEMFLLVETQGHADHPWGSIWAIVQQSDVVSVRCIPVASLHAWLRQHPQCLGENGELARGPTEQFAVQNAGHIHKWLKENTVQTEIEFVETLQPKMAQNSSPGT